MFTNRVAADGIAARLARTVRTAFGVPFPLALRAWDGSTTAVSDSAPGAPTVVLRSPRAFRHVVWCPSELGLARAYVTGAIDIDGDFRDALRTCLRFARVIRDAGPPGAGQWPVLLALLVRLGGVGLPPGAPIEEARIAGRPHSRRRDHAAIAHHYDLGNDFYELLLDPTMAYSCGYWMSSDESYGLADAQRDKLELICRRLGLAEGMRLLDVGCGWGSLLTHAAEQHGVRASGVTLSAQQADYVRESVRRRDLADRVDVRAVDYRDVRGDFDAVASVEMGEHVGEAAYPDYCRVLHDALRPGGRLLLQQMSHDDGGPGGGAFIAAYIAPDLAMRPLHRTIGHLERAGFEIRHVVSMREHYVRTIDAWARGLDTAWDEVVYRYGARRARIWRLYLAGGALAFEDNRMSVHQILAVRPNPNGTSGLCAPESGRPGEGVR